MRILHTVQYFAPDNGGGAEEVVRQISEGLVRRGHDVTVATGYSPARTQFERNGVKIVQFAVRGLLDQSVLGIHGDVSGYLGFLETGGFDVIMNYAAQTWHSDLTYRVLGRLRARTVLAACGYSGLVPPRSLLYRGYFRRLPSALRKYDAVVYHSANYRDKAFGDLHGVTNYRIIPNGCDAHEWARCEVDFRRQYGIDTRHMALCVGNHFRNKGHDRVIAAWRRLGRDDVTLVVIGRNAAARYRSCWGRCRRSAASSHGRLLLLDDAPRSHVVAAYRDADVFLSGSHIEAFPLVILESMAAGTPFVAFPAGNIAELKGGLVVHSVEEMARSVAWLLDDAEARRRLGSEGQAEQRQRYDWESIVGEYEWLYRDLLDRC